MKMDKSFNTEMSPGSVSDTIEQRIETAYLGDGLLYLEEKELPHEGSILCEGVLYTKKYTAWSPGAEECKFYFCFIPLMNLRRSPKVLQILPTTWSKKYCFVLKRLSNNSFCGEKSKMVR